MKKLLTLLFVLIAFIASAQDIVPQDTAYHALPTYSFKYYTKDSSVWIYKGAKYQTTKLVSNKRLKFLVDSLSGEFLHLNQLAKIDTVKNGTPVFGGLNIDTLNVRVVSRAGDLGWNASDGTIDFKMLNNTTNQLGQETYIYGKASGTIANGDPLQFAGAQGNHILIKKAVPAEIKENPLLFVGIATQNIANGNYGYCTGFGKVNGVYTTGWTSPSILYYDYIGGGLTVTKPSAPNPVIRVAVCIKEATGASENGVIMVRPTWGISMQDLDDVNGTPLNRDGQFAVWNNTNKYFDFTKDANGLKNYHGIQTIGAKSFNNTSHVLTIASGGLTYWNQGQKYTTTAAKSVDLDDATLVINKLYYVYFSDTTGVLRASQTPWNLFNHTFVATIFWNGTSGAVQDEDHTYTRDLNWHQWAHNSVGTRYISGLSKTSPLVGTDAVLSIGSGTMYDEDNIITIAAQTTMRGWYQVSAGVYTFADYSLPYTGLTGAPYYLDTDTYTLTAMSGSRYANYWVYGSNDIDKMIYVVPTHAANPYNTVALARAELPPNLANLGINPEMKILYRFIYNGSGAFQEATDYRNSSPLPAGGSSSTTAGAVSFQPYGTISQTTVQKALEQFNDSVFKNLTKYYVPRYDSLNFIKSKIYDNGKVHINGIVPDSMLTVTGGAHFTKGLKIDQITGFSPLKVVSTTKVDSLNADLLDGRHVDYLARRGYVDSTFTVKNDSSKLYERIANKVTSISSSSTDVQYPTAKLLYDQLLQKRALNNHDSLSTLDEKAYSSLTDKPDLTVYRMLNNHDSLSTLDEKAYASLTGKPDLTVYKEKSDSIANSGYASVYDVSLKANISHSQAQSTITDLADSLLARYTKTQADGRFAPLSHTQAQSTITALSDSLLARYTKTQANALLATKVAIADSSGVGGSGAAGKYATGKGLQYHVALTTTAHGGIVASNAAITAATKTKITYDAKGLVTAGADATTYDITATGNRRYITPADSIQLDNLSANLAAKVALADSVGGGAGKYATGKALSTHASLTAATGATGHLTSTDWNTFNGKAPASGSGNYIQNQSAAAQTGSSLWVDGVLKANGAATFASTVNATQLQSTVATGTAPLTVASTTMVSNLNADLLDGNHASAFQTALTNPVTGTGTTNYIPKWTGSGTLGNSPIYTDGTNVGIGTTAADYKLEVDGSIGLSSSTGSVTEHDGVLWHTRSSPNNILYIDSKGGFGGWGGVISMRTSNNGGSLYDRIWINSTGNVSIGTTNPGAYKLYVNGDMLASKFVKDGGTSAQYLLADGSTTTVAGAVYKGQLNGSNGTPIAGGSALADGTGTTGWYYACSTAGTYNYGSGNITLAVGDQLYYNGTIWLKIPGAGLYTLPIATASVLGGIKSSASVSIDGSTGVATVSTAYDASGAATTAVSGHESTYSHSNYNTAYTDRLKWDGGSTGLTAATGRTSLGLGSAATSATTDFTPSSHVGSTGAAHGNATALVAGFMTASDFSKLAGIAAGATNVTNTNQLTNGAGYITGYTETDPTIYAWAKAATKPSYTYSEVGAQVAGSYQAQLNGTGFIKASGTTISYDNSTYLTSEIDPVYSAWNKSTGISITKSQVSDFGTYQAPLVSGTNIKTINSTSLLGSGDISTIQTTVSGNAGSATVLGTARTINGVSFNGSANISVPSNIAPSTSGNVMTSNGSVWTSAAPATGMTYPSAGKVGTSTSGSSWDNTVATTTLMLNNQNNNTSTYTITSGNFILYSDFRLKRFIRPIYNPYFKQAEKIQFRAYSLKSDTTNQVRFGVIAQELERNIPELVNTDKDGMKSVNYIDMLILLVAQQKEAIRILEQRVDMLENKERSQR